MPFERDCHQHRRFGTAIISVPIALRSPQSLLSANRMHRPWHSVRKGNLPEVQTMESIVGIFNSLADAKRAAAILQSLGIPQKQITVLSPHTSESEIEARVPTTDTEQPGMGSALGGTVGAALGVAGGLEAGAAAASFLIPGVGPVLAFGLIGAALFGAGGAAAGAMAGGALEKGIADGVPR